MNVFLSLLHAEIYTETSFPGTQMNQQIANFYIYELQETEEMGYQPSQLSLARLFYRATG